MTVATAKALAERARNLARKEISRQKFFVFSRGAQTNSGASRRAGSMEQGVKNVIGEWTQRCCALAVIKEL